jgi:hypothetical protein
LSEFHLPLQQANALIFCHEDEYKPLGILCKFNKKHSSIERFRGGIYQHKYINEKILKE